ncbi:hypothetical protein MP228_011452 [Amoeboaphelidium protococcarum]|nr:hypothetical protein MP228_011452 [Amoeboaphelidium protococcarum]
MRSEDQVKIKSTTSPADSNTTAVDGQRSVKKLWQDQAQSNLILKRSHNKHNDANDEATTATSNDSIANQGDSVSSDGKSQDREGVEGKQERPKQMQRRRRTTEYQLKRLLEIFETITDTPSFGQRDGIAQELGMTNREVQVWFQNRRAKMAKLRAEALRRENTQRELMFNQLAMHGHIQQQQDIQRVPVAVAIDYATLKQHQLNDPRANYQILSSVNTTGLGLLPSKGNGDGFNSPAALSNFTQRPQSQRYNNATLPAMYVLSAQNERLLSIKQQQQQKNTALGLPVQVINFGQSSALKQEYTVDSGRVSDFSGSDGKTSVGLSSPFRDIDLQGGQGFGIGRTANTGLSRQESDDLKLDKNAGLAGVNYSTNLQVSSIQKDQSQMLNVPSNNSSDHQFFLKGVGGHSVSDFIQSPHLSNELPSWFISNNSTTFAVPVDASSLPSLSVNYQSYRYEPKYKDLKQHQTVVNQSQELESPTDKVFPFFKSKMPNDANYEATDKSMGLQKSNAIGHSEKDSAVDHAPSIISNSARPFKKQRQSVSL